MTITIELTKGQVTLIDDIDADLADFKWSASPVNAGVNDYYAAGKITKAGKKQKVRAYLHRVILERIEGRPLVKTELTDHINGDKLDNRRANLRISTYSQNQHNQGRRNDNKSGYKGVYWHSRRMKWIAQIGLNGHIKRIGQFDTPELAYAAYCQVAAELHGKFARFE